MKEKFYWKDVAAKKMKKNLTGVHSQHIGSASLVFQEWQARHRSGLALSALLDSGLLCWTRTTHKAHVQGPNRSAHRQERHNATQDKVRVKFEIKQFIASGKERNVGCAQAKDGVYYSSAGPIVHGARACEARARPPLPTCSCRA